MFTVVGRTYKVDKKLLEKVAKAAFSYLKLDADIELKFVTEEEITRLNSVYRGASIPTDVLSFNISDKPLLGQVFICYNFVKKQALNIGKPFPEEVSLLLTHGILHISGYDHTSTQEEKAMQQIEREILKNLGMTR
jgi:probable rRNA maturation factor